MSKALNYKGYTAKIEYSVDDGMLYGKIEGINDLVTFECNAANEVESEFQSAVDDYIAFCKEVGKNPEKAYKGSFNIRTTPEMHRQLAIYANTNGISLNDAANKAFESLFADKPVDGWLSKIAGFLPSAFATESVEGQITATATMALQEGAHND